MQAIVILNPSLDLNIKAKLDDKNQIQIKESTITLNDYCKTALSEAIRFKEKGLIKNILAITIGPSFYQKYLNYALKMGVDKSLLILNKKDIKYSPLNLSKIYKIIIKKEKADLVFLGCSDEKTNYHQTAPILASILNYNLSINIDKIEMSNKKIFTIANIDTQKIKMTINFPTILAFQNYLKNQEILLKEKNYNKEKIEIILLENLNPNLKNKLTITERNDFANKKKPVNVDPEYLPVLIHKMLNVKRKE